VYILGFPEFTGRRYPQIQHTSVGKPKHRCGVVGNSTSASVAIVASQRAWVRLTDRRGAAKRRYSTKPFTSSTMTNRSLEMLGEHVSDTS
jgi:hypothetical protein